MRPSPSALAMIALSLAALGCGGEPSGRFAATPVALDPQARHDERFLVWGGTVAIGGLERTVLSASKSVVPPAEVTREGDQHRITSTIPADLRPAGWIILEAFATRDGTTSFIRSIPGPSTQAGTAISLAVPDAKVGPGGRPGVRLYPAPDLASRDVDSVAVRVPAHAVLQVGMALEQASWQTTAIPLDMTVSAVVDDQVTVLGTTRLDANRPEQRQWVDVTIPLEPVAGRSVRLRFAARPIVGPTNVPSLPVWAEPTIVDARLVGK